MNTFQRKRHSRGVLVALLLLCLAFLTSCSSNADLDALAKAINSDVGLITGTISYPGTYLITEGTVVIDISLSQYDTATGQTIEISHQRIRNPQRFPVNYTIRFDKADILPYMRYSISAQVRRSGDANPYLVSSEDIPVLSNNNTIGKANIQLVPVPQAGE